MVESEGPPSINTSLIIPTSQHEPPHTIPIDIGLQHMHSTPLPSSQSHRIANQLENISNEQQPNGETEQLPSPVQLDDIVLNKQATAAINSEGQPGKDQNFFQESQAFSVDKTGKEMHHTRVASLQQSLNESEHSQQMLEKQLVDLESSHSREIEHIVRQHKAAKELALQERDKKHAAHILRLTAELSAQQEFVNSGKPDWDEQEAQRIQIIKQSMKELHEKEITQMRRKHDSEKLQLSEEFKQQMMNSTQQMEQVANAKIQEMHGQFMSAHQLLMEQKNAAESNIECIKAQLQQATAQLETVETEKKSIEAQYHVLLKSHSAEVEEMKMNAHNLEERVNTWKDKAAGLESRLKLSGEAQENVLHIKEQYETKVHTITEEYEESLESAVKQQTEKNALLQEQLQRVQEEAQFNYQEKLEQLQSQHGSEVEQLENALLQEQLQRVQKEAQFNYQEKLEQLQSQHGSEVEQLEKSISEALSDKASLEAAEEHMSSLQKQLKAYRMQETDMNDKITRLQEEQALVIDLLKQRHEQEKKHELDLLRAELAAEINELQGELYATQDLGRTGGLAGSEGTLHSEELACLKKDLQVSHTEALSCLRSNIEEDHRKATEWLKQQHQIEIEQLKKSLEEALKQSAKIEADYEMKVIQLKEAHEVEMTKDSDRLEQTVDNPVVDELNSQVATLTSELQTLHNEKAEWSEMHRDLMSELEKSQREIDEGKAHLIETLTSEEGLREKCRLLTSEIQSVESDCHIAQSDRAHMQQLLDEAQTKVKELISEGEKLKAEMAGMETACQEQAQKLLRVTDQLADRNMTIANLQSQNDTFNSEVLSLTEKSQRQVSCIEMLQQQVKNAGAVNEEVTALQQQMSYLAPVKEQNAHLKKSVSEFEVTIQNRAGEIDMLQTRLSELMDHHTQLKNSLNQCEANIENKDKDISLLKTELQQMQDQIIHLESLVQSKEGEIQAVRCDYDNLREKADQFRATVQSKDATIASLRGDLDQANTQVRELNTQWDTKLEEVTARFTVEIESFKAAHLAQENLLRQQIEQKEMLFTQVESRYNAQQEEISSAKEELAELQSQFQESMCANHELAEVNKTLSAEVKMLQEQSQSESYMELKSRYSELEHNFTILLSEKERLSAELIQVQEEGNESVESTPSFEVNVMQLEDTLKELRSQLSSKEQAFVNMQNQLNKKLAEAEQRELAFHERHKYEKKGLVAGQQSALEESLSHARRKLTEKLQEKQILEKDLSFHRTELERRLGEKQRLEGLLFEKSRFEQELMNQKQQLQSDLLQIGSKMDLGPN